MSARRARSARRPSGPVACGLSFRQLIGCQDHHSNHMVVIGGETMCSVRREVDIEALAEEVWEALVTEEGRERWLDEPEREVHVEVAERRIALVWWWVGGATSRPRASSSWSSPRRAGHARGRDRVRAGVPAGQARREPCAGGRLSDDVGPVFAALADPTRRSMVERCCATARPPSRAHGRPADHPPGGRQAPGDARPCRPGRARARARARGALPPARRRAAVGDRWLAEAEAAWDSRLARLKDAVERDG